VLLCAKLKDLFNGATVAVYTPHTIQTRTIETQWFQKPVSDEDNREFLKNTIPLSKVLEIANQQQKKRQEIKTDIETIKKIMAELRELYEMGPDLGFTFPPEIQDSLYAQIATDDEAKKIIELARTWHFNNPTLEQDIGVNIKSIINSSEKNPPDSDEDPEEDNNRSSFRC
jgi:hypothetical protein